MSSRSEEKRRLREEREARERAREQSARMRRRLQLLGALAAAAVVVVVVVIVASGGGGSKKANLTEPPTGAAEVSARFSGIPQNGTALGNPKAPVTLLEFADLKCPVCRDYTLKVFPQLVDRYVRTGKVRMVMEMQDFVANQDNDSEHAARMALAAGMQNRLWQFADLFYLNQQDEATTYVNDAFLRHIGSGVRGLNVDRALSERDSSQITQQLQQALSLYNTGGFTGTPSFAVGKTDGTMQPIGSGLLPASEISGAIDKLLPK